MEVEMPGHGDRLRNTGADKIVVTIAAAAQLEISVGRVDGAREGGVAPETQGGVAVQSVIDKGHRVTGVLDAIASQAGRSGCHVHLQICSGIYGNPVTAAEVKGRIHEQFGAPGDQHLAGERRQYVVSVGEDVIIGGSGKGRILPPYRRDTRLKRHFHIRNVHVCVVRDPAVLNADVGESPGLVANGAVGPDGDAAVGTGGDVTTEVSVA